MPCADCTTCDNVEITVRPGRENTSTKSRGIFAESFQSCNFLATGGCPKRVRRNAEALSRNAPILRLPRYWQVAFLRNDSSPIIPPPRVEGCGKLLAVTLVALEDARAKPILYLMRGLLRRFGSMNNIGDSTLLSIRESWRVVRKVTAECAHVGLIRHGWSTNFAHHVNRMDTLDDHLY